MRPAKGLRIWGNLADLPKISQIQNWEGVRQPPKRVSLAGSFRFRLVIPAKAGIHLSGMNKRSCIVNPWWGISY